MRAFVRIPLAIFVSMVVLTAIGANARAGGITPPPEKYFLSNSPVQVMGSDLDGASRVVVVGPFPPPAKLEDLHVNKRAGKITWTDSGNKKVQSANLDGTRLTTVKNLSSNADVTAGVPAAPRGAVSFDGKVYWSDEIAGTIERANFDGTSFETIVISLDGPRGLDIDGAARKIYWIEGSVPKIQRANLDGSSIEAQLTAGLVDPQNISLDVFGAVMYWTDAVSNKIQVAGLEIPAAETAATRTDVADVVTGLTAPRGIDIDRDEARVYWTEPSMDRVRRRLIAGGIIEDTDTAPGISGPTGIGLLNARAIPTVSAWGSLMLVLLVLVAGSVAFRSRKPEVC